jgi:hypothetical protein
MRITDTAFTVHTHVGNGRPKLAKKAICSNCRGVFGLTVRTKREIRQIEGGKLAKKAICSNCKGVLGLVTRTKREIRQIEGDGSISVNGD